MSRPLRSAASATLALSSRRGKRELLLAHASSLRKPYTWIVRWMWWLMGQWGSRWWTRLSNRLCNYYRTHRSHDWTRPCFIWIWPWIRIVLAGSRRHGCKKSLGSSRCVTGRTWRCRKVPRRRFWQKMHHPTNSNQRRSQNRNLVTVLLPTTLPEPLAR
jgi:hypothetical protein